MTREEAIKQLRLLKGDITFGIASKVENKNQIEALSIAIACLETDEAYQLEYESTTKNDLRVDCISRADAIGSIAVECSAEKLDIDYAKFLMLRRAIKALPTVTPISKDCTDCIAEDKTFMKMDRIKQLLNSDKLDDSEVLEKIIEVVEE